jgi:hypothetical protein
VVEWVQWRSRFIAGSNPNVPTAGRPVGKPATRTSRRGCASVQVRRSYEQFVSDSAPGVSQLRVADGILQERTVFGDRTHLDLRTVREARALLSDGDSFVEGVHLQQKIAADRFFRFRKRTIGNQPTIIAGHHLALHLEGAASHHLSLGSQTFEPRHPLAGNALHFFG